jgi:hypothetical protein
VKNLQRVRVALNIVIGRSERVSLLEGEVCVVAQMSSMLLRISEPVDDVHGNNCILHRLINLGLQIARAEDIVLKDSYRIDQVLIHAVFEFRD